MDNNKIRTWQYLYGVISNNKIIDEVIAVNGEDAYKKYRNLEFFADVCVERKHNEIINGIEYKSFYDYETKCKARTMVFFICL